MYDMYNIMYNMYYIMYDMYNYVLCNAQFKDYVMQFLYIIIILLQMAHYTLLVYHVNLDLN